MPQFVEPPIFNVPRGAPFGNVIKDAGGAIADVMSAIDADEERKRKRKAEDIAAAMAGEDTMLKLSPLLSEFEDAKPVPMMNPADPELGTPETKALDLPLGDKRLAKPLLNEITLPDGRKVPIPPVRGSLERNRAEDAAKANAGTEVLTQAAWDALPEFYQKRWKPGQRVDSAAIGAIGMEVLKSANAKTSKTPNFQAQYDRQRKEDVMVSDEIIAQDPNRYGPPREARVAAEAGRDEARTAAADAKATAAADKKTERERQITDWVQSLQEGKAMEEVPASIRNEVNSAFRAATGSAPLNRYQQQQAGILGSLDGMVDRVEEKAMAVIDRMDDFVTRNLPGGTRVAGWHANAMASLGKAPEVKDLENVEAELTRIARGLADERGNVSDKDVARISKAIPHTGDTRKEMQNKIAQLRAIIKERRTGLRLPTPGAAAAPATPTTVKPGTKIGRFTVLSVE